MKQPYESFDDVLSSFMQDPKFKKEWDALEPEAQLSKLLYKARIEHHLTQHDLSVLTGINQSNLSKIESGKSSPSLKTIKKIADKLGYTINLQFVPKYS